MRTFTTAFLGLAAAALAGCVSSYPASLSDIEGTSATDAARAAMSPDQTIARNLASSPEHTILSRALTATGLAQTLDAAGPFTLFAPTDRAFGFIDAARLEQLLAPENQAQLTTLLSRHVVPGRVTAADILARVEAGGGQATYTTLAGDELTFFASDGVIRIEGPGRARSSVVQANITQANGIVHILDAVLTQ